MFGFTLTLHVRLERKTEFLGKALNEIALILKRSAGSLEFLVLQDDIELDKFLILSLWQTREHAKGYHATGYNKTKSILEPYLTLPLLVRTYRVEDTIPRSLGTLQPEPPAMDHVNPAELKIVHRR